MARCPTCKREAPAGATTCPHDGSPLAKQGTGTLLRATPPPPARSSSSSSASAATAEKRLTDLDSILAGESQPIAPGTRMGEYEVTEKIGEGGMGEVFAAVHPIIGKKVAIKVLSDAVAANREVVRRFVDEARAVNKIGHSNIVDVFSFGQHVDGRHFYVMEHLDGISLEDELTERGTLPAAEIVEILTQTLDALQAAHDSEIIHRDLKPDNVFLTRDSRGRGIKLLDFGIAKLSGDESRSRTQTGMALGTPDYMSPEQCRGAKIDLRTDIYAVGIMLYRMFTGHFPFEGIDHVLELFMKVAHDPPPPPSTFGPLPKAFEDIILKCIEKDPSDRFFSAEELSEQLVTALESPGEILDTSRESTSSREDLGRGVTADMPGKESETSEQEVASAVSPTAVRAEASEDKTSLTKTAERQSSLLFPALGAAVVGLAAVAFFIFQNTSESSGTKEAPKRVALGLDAGGGTAMPTPSVLDAALPPAADAVAAAAYGSLRVQTGNRAAQVWIDDVLVGRGKQVDVLELLVGDHVLRVSAPKFEEQKLQIEVAEGKVLQQKVRLARLLKSSPGRRPDAGGKEDKKPPVVDPDQTLGWDGESQ